MLIKSCAVGDVIYVVANYHNLLIYDEQGWLHLPAGHRTITATILRHDTSYDTNYPFLIGLGDDAASIGGRSQYMASIPGIAPLTPEEMRLYPYILWVFDNLYVYSWQVVMPPTTSPTTPTTTATPDVAAAPTPAPFDWDAYNGYRR